MTFKFALGTALCVVLVVVLVPVLLEDYQQRLRDYSSNVTANEEDLRKVKVYMNIAPTVFRPPTILSVFSEGYETRLANAAKIEFESIPEVSLTSSETNPYLSIFPVLDVTLIFKIVLGILALLIAYDVVSGEAQRGTLRLTLSNAIARPHVLLGKLLSGLLTLLLPITITFVVGLLILGLSPAVSLALADWTRIGLMYVTSVIFISAMFSLGLLVSTMARKSATCLILALLCWIVYAVVIPSASVSFATNARILEPREKVAGQLAALEQTRESEKKKWHADFGYTLGALGHNRDAFGREYVMWLTKSTAEHTQKRYAFYRSLSMAYADRLLEVERSHLFNVLKQKSLADALARISPLSLYENVMSSLSGTDLIATRSFMERARAYRNEVIEYIRSKTDDFRLPSYFTTMTMDEMAECQQAREEISRLIKLKDAADKSAGEKLSSAIERRNKLLRDAGDKPSVVDLEGFPTFTYEPPGVVKSLKYVAPDLVLLLLSNSLFLTLSFVTFLRYDVR